MIGRILTAYRAELTKAMHQRFTYAGPVLLVLAVLCAAYLKREEAAENAYSFIAYATAATLNLAGLFLLLAFAAGLVVSEIASGTARLIFVRPVKRHEYVLAKLLLGLTYALCLTALVAAASWATAAAMGSLQGVTYGGELLFAPQEMLAAYLLGLALALLPQFAAVAYALLISSIARNTGAAVSLAIVMWVLVDTVKYGLGIQDFLFTTWWDAPWDVFSGRCDGLNPAWTPRAFWCAGTSIAAAAMCTALACMIIQRRDLNA